MTFNIPYMLVAICFAAVVVFACYYFYKYAVITQKGKQPQIESLANEQNLSPEHQAISDLVTKLDLAPDSTAKGTVDFDDDSLSPLKSMTSSDWCQAKTTDPTIDYRSLTHETKTVFSRKSTQHDYLVLKLSGATDSTTVIVANVNTGQYASLPFNPCGLDLENGPTDHDVTWALYQQYQMKFSNFGPRYNEQKFKSLDASAIYHKIFGYVNNKKHGQINQSLSCNIAATTSSNLAQTDANHTPRMKPLGIGSQTANTPAVGNTQ